MAATRTDGGGASKRRPGLVGDNIPAPRPKMTVTAKSVPGKVKGGTVKRTVTMKAPTRTIAKKAPGGTKGPPAPSRVLPKPQPGNVPQPMIQQKAAARAAAAQKRR